MTALKRPNILVSWNLDNGKIVKHTVVPGIDLTHFNKHSDWNGLTVLKEIKEAEVQEPDNSFISKGMNDDDEEEEETEK